MEKLNDRLYIQRRLDEELKTIDRFEKILTRLHDCSDDVQVRMTSTQWRWDEIPYKVNRHNKFTIEKDIMDEILTRELVRHRDKVIFLRDQLSKM